MPRSEDPPPRIAGFPEVPPGCRVELLEATPTLLRIRHPGDASRVLGSLPTFLGLALALGALLVSLTLVVETRDSAEEQLGLLGVVVFVTTVWRLANSSRISAPMRIDLELRPELLQVTRGNILWSSRQRLQLAPGALARLWVSRDRDEEQHGIHVFGARYTLQLAGPFDEGEARWLVEAMNAFFMEHFDPSSRQLDEPTPSVLRVGCEPAGELSIDLIGARATYTWLQRLLALSLLVGVASRVVSNVLPWQSSPWLALAVHSGIVVGAAFFVFSDRLYYYRVSVDEGRIAVQHRGGGARGFEHSMPRAYVLGVELHTDSADPGCFVRGALRSINLTPEHDLGTAVHVGRIVVAHLREVGADIEAPRELDLPPSA